MSDMYIGHYIWALYSTSISDIYIGHCSNKRADMSQMLLPTCCTDIYIWHLYLTFIFDILKTNAKTVKKHYVFHQNRSKSSTFDENPCRFWRKVSNIVKNRGKTCVLSIFKLENIINCGFSYVFSQPSCTFDENPCGFSRKFQKSEKTVCFSSEKFSLRIKQ